MGRKRNQPLIVTPAGWHDTEPDTTSDEHDLMAAMIAKAWSDIKIDLRRFRDTSRYDEMVAAKITAYEWVQSDDEFLMSFRSACLFVGIKDVQSARAEMTKEYYPPSDNMSESWRKEMARTDRGDTIYIKHKKPKEKDSVVESVLANEIVVDGPKLLPPAADVVEEELDSMRMIDELKKAISLKVLTKQALSGAANWLRAGNADDEEV